VAHGVGKIQKKTSIPDWYHIGTKENPADIISRGYCPSSLVDMLLWWYGPHLLTEEEEKEPILSKTSNIIDSKNHDLPIFSKYSSLNKLLCLVSYCLRFYYKKIRREKIIISLCHV
jgi:hypothetical protein